MSAGVAARVPPAPDDVIRWYNAEIERARSAEARLSNAPLHVKWKRSDSFTYTPAELAELRTDAQRRPQSRARSDLQRAETSQQRGGLEGENELWFGDAGFRHNQNLKYDGPGAFVDSVCGKESGWSLTPHAINKLPKTATPESYGRGADQFRKGFLQDLLPSFTGGLSEIARREFDAPAARGQGDGFVIEIPASRDKFIQSATVRGQWDGGSGTGRVQSLVLHTRPGGGPDQSFSFEDWGSAAGLIFARHAVRAMPVIHTTISIEVEAMEIVQEAEVRRVIEEPKNPGGGQDYEDAVRGKLTLGSRMSYSQAGLSSERLSRDGAVPVDVPQPDHSGSVLQVLGWLLGGGVVATVAVLFWWKKARA